MAMGRRRLGRAFDAVRARPNLAIASARTGLGIGVEPRSGNGLMREKPARAARQWPVVISPHTESLWAVSTARCLPA